MAQELLVIISISVISLLFSIFMAVGILKKPAGTKKMEEIGEMIHKGAMAFLNKEYKIMVVFIIVVAIILYFVRGWETTFSFVLGGLFSALAGNLGMRIATKANTRTAHAVKDSINAGLRVAFNSGAVMGLSVVGLGLLGVAVLYMIFHDPNIIFGFGLGASSIALFARVGGGIYTKAADVGADLVGKVEAGIPEDDPRNPAVIADNVGDNVGDVAGMGADLFESYVDSLIAAMLIGTVVFAKKGLGVEAALLPLAIAATGIVASIIGTFFVHTRHEHKVHAAMNRGIFGASILTIIASYFVIQLFIKGAQGLNIFYATVAGLVSGVIIGLATEYYTSNDKKPAQSIAKASETGAATNIIAGLGVGMMSTVIPVLAVSAAIILSYYFAGMYGIAIAAVGMLSTLGITLASDTYGPVADNAAGISEMAGLGKEVRKRAEALDAVGNTTAAIGKGFAIGSAALTALVLFVSYTQVTGLTSIDLTNPNVFVGLLLGAVLPFVFSAFTITAVGHAAEKMVAEVRRQFKTIKGLMKGKAKPDYEKCIAISTGAALHQMIAPCLIAVVVPIVVGIWSVEALGGLLAGITATGFLMAVFMSNAGGAWDNAKKYIEEGHLGGKGSPAHRAAVEGDTVGDPMKDTAGPSLNILIKAVSIIALVFVPLFL
ncbi:TPA: sodium-translocating pyrophosphatase [Candidatus Woesearchaeota archaeon]|nr:sodium-translocating pyrophosphatase [Candidatus Woesearchaeota archaeon]